ncbi:MAG: ATP-binding cassette domain-containing protein [Thermoprotei archaeon]
MNEYLVSGINLTKHFESRRSLTEFLVGRRPVPIRAVDGVDIQIKRGEILSLVGESGSGKTTLGRLLLLLEKPTSGEVWFDGKRIDNITGSGLKAYRKRMQMIYQDPYGSLNPKLRVSEIVSEPLRVNGVEVRKDRLAEYLALSGLRPPESFLERYPHELSGGQRQRVAIARAMILEPEFVVADEPVSMLDVSLRSEILGVIKRFNQMLKTSFLLITHDLAVAAQVSSRIMVMYLGKVVEEGDTARVLRRPKHPYTQTLLSVVPRLGGSLPKALPKGEIPSAKNIPSGCRFHPRCAYALQVCSTEEPELRFVDGSRVSCHLVEQILGGTAKQGAA